MASNAQCQYTFTGCQPLACTEALPVMCGNCTSQDELASACRQSSLLMPCSHMLRPGPMTGAFCAQLASVAVAVLLVLTKLLGLLLSRMELERPKLSGLALSGMESARAGMPLLVDWPAGLATEGPKPGCMLLDVPPACWKGGMRDWL